MNAMENFDALVLGGGTAGKLAAWTMAKEGRRTAVVDRKYIGGACPNDRGTMPNSSNTFEPAD